MTLICLKLLILLSSLIDPRLNGLEDSDPLVREQTAEQAAKDPLLIAKIPFNQGLPEKNHRMAGIVTNQLINTGEDLQEWYWSFGHEEWPDYSDPECQFMPEECGGFENQ